MTHAMLATVATRAEPTSPLSRVGDGLRRPVSGRRPGTVVITVP